MYASTHPYTTDEKTGKRKYVNLHWGTVADGNRFIPGRRYIFASPEERAKLVFPKDWDLSEANKLSEPRPQDALQNPRLRRWRVNCTK